MTAKRATKAGDNGNYIAEWYGHRVYPSIDVSEGARAAQINGLCPFLTEVKGEVERCAKTAAASKGVCTVSSIGNGVRRDWAVCPLRAFDLDLLQDAARRLFGYEPAAAVVMVAAPTLSDAARRGAFVAEIAAGANGVIFFHEKAGGEIKISATPRSPQVSFDVTLVQILPDAGGGLNLGKYGVIEIQTMDFHGSYGKATNNLNTMLAANPGQLGIEIARDPTALGEGVETPNIANVFKRTFYQMMFKFQLAAHEHSAGCIFAIPRSVWESWQRYLGAPDLEERGDGTWQLRESYSAVTENDHPPVWIYVFDVEISDQASPNRLTVWKAIGTDARSLSHYALDVAPAAALEAGGSADTVMASIRRRIGNNLPLVDQHGQQQLWS
ncbi:hypothetical protein [Micromonospora sp. NPDC049282]|uniref:hypothetical protein n=1 Tax=Micromonospora sp. NPDC049282 TaxID=3364269 RepID=UPI003715E44A